MATESTFEDRMGRSPTGRWILSCLQGMTVLLTVIEFGGVTWRGYRFLGRFGDNPVALWVAVLVLTVLAWLPCLYVLLRRRGSARPWLRRLPFYSNRARLVTFGLLLASATATAVLFLSILRYDVVHAAPVSEGRLGVAVAQFGEGVEFEPSARGRELSAFVARVLRREIEVRPSLAAEVTVISASLVADEEDALRIAGYTRTSLVIWGWVSQTVDDTFVPSFTFVQTPGVGASLGGVPPWYEVEISGDGTLELSRTVARRATGLIEYILGLLYLQGDDYVAATAMFREAIERTVKEAREDSATEHEMQTLERSLAIYYLALGRAIAAQGDQQRALAEYRAAMAYDPDYGPIYIGVGNIDYNEGRCSEALKWYDQAVELLSESKKAPAFYSRGNAHYCLGQFESAALDYEQAIQKASSDDKAQGLFHLVYGVTLCRLNRFSEGLAMIQQAQELAAPGGELDEAAASEWSKWKAEATGPSTGTVVSTATPLPTLLPTASPTATGWPTAQPTASASPIQTAMPTLFPTAAPTSTPWPTAFPTVPPPTASPTLFPTTAPTASPTRFPTTTATPTPTLFPTEPPPSPSPTLTSFPTVPPPSPSPTVTSFPTVPPPSPSPTPFPTWPATATQGPPPVGSPVPTIAPPTSTPVSNLLATPAP